MRNERLLLLKKPDDASTATLDGLYNSDDVAAPPSPLLPKSPLSVPAIVLITVTSVDETTAHRTSKNNNSATIFILVRWIIELAISRFKDSSLMKGSLASQRLFYCLSSPRRVSRSELGVHSTWCVRATKRSRTLVKAWTIWASRSNQTIVGSRLNFESTSCFILLFQT